ncbi:MAG: caspase family protein [Deltaproteobacteria bacterium]|nr:caspase family protein [Deltaproteobacteria bacterium]
MTGDRKAHALVIGINAYATKPLRYAVDDATALAEVLSKNERGTFTVEQVFENEATRKGIMNGVRRLAESRADLKLLYFAGHAALLSTGAHLVPVDFVDWTDLIPMRELADSLLSSLVDDDALIVIADCCHAGALELDNSLMRVDLREAMAKEVEAPNVACLLACTPGSTARESSIFGHGVFTYHLVDALTGTAADISGNVTPETAYQHVARELNLTSHQRPVFKARITGYLPILEYPSRPDAERKRREEMRRDADELRGLLDGVEEKLAELKPPFSSRQNYRETGWQRACKIVGHLVQKKEKVALKWGDDLKKSNGWVVLENDISSLVSELANVGIGTHTEFGEIVSKLGEGGFGAVYKVQDIQGVSRALKVFHGQELGNSAKQSRFRIGYKAMDQLAHPNVVKVEKFMECPLGFYMEFVDGNNLRRGYGSEQDPAEVLRLLLSLAETVEYANGQGVRHRDIKPENVILYWNEPKDRWDTKLTDFDLAWFPTATSHTVEAFGAPFYAAPEQLSQPGEEVAHRETVDVYGLTMLAVYLINGTDPVHVQRAFENFERNLKDWPPTAAKEMLALVQEGGSEDPELRIPTVSEFRGRLLRVRDLHFASKDPLAPVSEREFFGRARAILDASVEDGTDVGTFRFVSLSGRTQYTAKWQGDVVVADVQKIDSFMAEAATHADARRSLARRIDTMLERREFGRADVRRHEGGLKAYAGMQLTIRNLPCSLSGAADFAAILADVVAVYEQF